jgi:NADPH:quinone reductase-like Zn-dependent oxidoreductase
MKPMEIVMNMMRSIKYESYGGPEVLNLVQTPIPEPGAGELLVKVKSSSVTAADWHLRKADPFMVRIMNGLMKPGNKVLGQEFAGEVVKTGSSVTRFNTGDLVFGSTGMKTGSYAEFIVVNEDSVLVKAPENVDYEVLASVPIGALTAQFFLGKGNLSSGKRVLINGASGSVGTYAVQIAKTAGAQVTGVCSTKNVALVQSLGADSVIDYKITDFTKSHEQFDIIFDTAGNLNFRLISENLTEKGYFISTAFNLGLMVEMMKNVLRKGKKVYTGVTKESRVELEKITAMIKNGAIKPVISRRYTMEEIREAHRYAETGHKRGNVLLTIDNGESDARS